MNIAQVAPLFESVPPRQYGGTERVVSYLTEELVRQGHRVTLFASGDSVTAAHLVAPAALSRRPDSARPSWLAAHCIELDLLYAQSDAFDIIHFHTDYLHFPLARRLRTPHLTTLHGRLDLPELTPLFDHFDDLPLVSISDAQRTPVAHACWQRTIHHGLPRELYRFSPRASGHLLFLGRLSPEKGPDRAIEIARRSGVPLIIAAKIDEGMPDYFEQVVKPLLDHPIVRFIGEVDDSQKAALLADAIALLCPIDWPEPFGLVMIEAMACGTPVIAYRHGAVPEIIEHGSTGFIVDSEDEAVNAVRALHVIDRRRCRAAFEQRFTVERMTADYLQLYEDLQAHGAAAYPAAAYPAKPMHRRSNG